MQSNTSRVALEFELAVLDLGSILVCRRRIDMSVTEQ